MPRIRTLLAGGIAVSLLSIPVLHAQHGIAAETQTTMSDLSIGAGCEVLPGGETEHSDGHADNQAADNSLSETLDRCGGVLVPPAIGGDAFVTSPPEEGTTPVIPPSAIPEAE